MKKKILIVASNYYNKIIQNLIDGAIKKLKINKKNIKIIKVPGTYEIPVVISKNLKRFDGFIVLGCVIKGETPHFDFICNSVFSSLIGLMIKSNKPIANSILTTNNSNQALKRVKKKSKESVNSLKSFL